MEDKGVHRQDAKEDRHLLVLTQEKKHTRTTKKRTDSRRSMQKDIKDKITTPRETKETREHTNRERENKRRTG